MQEAQRTPAPSDAPAASRRRPARAPRVTLYIFGQFPLFSETFLLREINALAARGLSLQVLALAPGPSGALHPSAQPWLSQVIYRPPVRSLALWLSALLGALAAPAAATSALRMALTLLWRYPSRSREVVVSLLSAGYFSWRLRGMPVRHIHAAFASVPATVGVFLAELTGRGFSFAGHARDLFTHEASFLSLKAREAEFAAVCSQVGYQHLREAFPVRQRGRLHLIHHGLDPSHFLPTPRLMSSRPIILCAGRLVPKKGHAHLLKAASILLARDRNFEVHIFGDGPLAAPLGEMIASLGLSDCVFLHGSVPEEELHAAYQDADVLVLPSAQAPDGDNEGIPNVLLEALSLQVPVIATRTGGIPEVIQDGVTGLLVQPGDPSDLADAIDRLLVDDRLRLAMAAAGRLRVEQDFDLNNNVRELFDLFRAAAG
jgi:glycosyltransferase involved in cell wall biosynthesis